MKERYPVYLNDKWHKHSRWNMKASKLEMMKIEYEAKKETLLEINAPRKGKGMFCPRE